MTDTAKKPFTALGDGTRATWNSEAQQLWPPRCNYSELQTLHKYNQIKRAESTWSAVMRTVSCTLEGNILKAVGPPEALYKWVLLFWICGLSCCFSLLGCHIYTCNISPGNHPVMEALIVLSPQSSSWSSLSMLAPGVMGFSIIPTSSKTYCSLPLAQLPSAPYCTLLENRRSQSQGLPPISMSWWGSKVTPTISKQKPYKPE